MLVKVLGFCESNLIDIELSRLGRNAFKPLEVVKRLVNYKIKKNNYLCYIK
jgi:hypothetical protein